MCSTAPFIMIPSSLHPGHHARKGSCSGPAWRDRRQVPAALRAVPAERESPRRVAKCATLDVLDGTLGQTRTPKLKASRAPQVHVWPRPPGVIGYRVVTASRGDFTCDVGRDLEHHTRDVWPNRRNQ